MQENGPDPAARRDLRDYKLVTFEELRVLVYTQQQLKHLAERLSARLVVAHKHSDDLDASLANERGLLNIALHELALAAGAKDPQQFIRRWLHDHQERMEGW
jgi:hypothetical protein